MSSIIKSIFIPFTEVCYTAEYITDILYVYDIAIVSRITMLPVITKTEIYNRVYIDIAEWLPSETAYNFIQRLRDPLREARIVHCDDEWWNFEINNNTFITYAKSLASFTTINYLIMEEQDFTYENKVIARNIKKQEEEDESEWKSIEKDLSEMLVYQTLEYELCL